MRKHFCLFLLASIFYSYATLAQNASAKNPVVHADVPDMSMIRVGDTYYMSSTTMHMAPGVPIMKSKDLVNWELVSYCYDILADVDALNLNNGKNAFPLPHVPHIPAHADVYSYHICNQRKP